jgi:sRNA-binding carbon storage regulator CsrA
MLVLSIKAGRSVIIGDELITVEVRSTGKTAVLYIEMEPHRGILARKGLSVTPGSVFERGTPIVLETSAHGSLQATEHLKIGEGIVFEIEGAGGSSVYGRVFFEVLAMDRRGIKVGITAPSDVSIHRDEVFDRIKERGGNLLSHRGAPV